MREGRDIVKMRWWCLRKRKQDWSGNKIAAHLQIPRSTAYYWIDKYRGCRKEEMANKRVHTDARGVGSSAHRGEQASADDHRESRKVSQDLWGRTLEFQNTWSIPQILQLQEAPSVSELSIPGGGVFQGSKG